MNEPKMLDAEKTRRRRLAFGAGAMILLAVCVFGRLFYLQQQARTGQYAQVQGKAAKVDEAMAAVRLAKVKRLRDMWRPWALNHKAELRAMLQAGPNNEGAMNTVWKGLPFPDKDWSLMQGLSVNDFEGGSAPYSWWPIIRAPMSPDTPAQDAALLRRTSARMAKFRQKDFREWHDIQLSESGNWGPKSLQLFASGRVLEEETIHNPERGHGKPSAIQVRREVLPPYDFLQ